MVRYHVFLLGAFNSRDDQGQPFSFAQIGGAWTLPLADWAHHYRRVFERAVEKIETEPTFIERLARVPFRLLARKPEQVSEAVETTTLDIARHLVVMLEQWMKRQVTIDPTPEEEKTAPVAPIRFTGRNYERVLISFTGVWEELLHFGDTRQIGQTNQTETPAAQWDARRTRWSFLERHLWNSAYFLALAVCSADEVGAERFRDILLRWIDSAQGTMQPDHLLRHHVLLTPQLFQLSWTQMGDRVLPLMRHPPPPSANPNGVFTSILYQCADDIVALTGAMALGWYIDRRQASDIGGRTAKLLIGRVVMPNEGSRRMGNAPPQPKTFHWILWSALRANIGEENDQPPYGVSIDGFINFIDCMRDRQMVSGRIYSGWGRDGLATLTLPLLAILLAHLPEEDDDTVVRKFAALNVQEDYFGDGDNSVRRIESALDEYKLALTTEPNLPLLERGARIFLPAIDMAASIQRLDSLFSGMKAALQAQRTHRLLARPVAPERLGKYRLAMDEAVSGLQPHILPFQNFDIRRQAFEDGEEQQWVCRGMDKAQLTVPPLAREQTDLPTTLASWFQDDLLDRIWRSFGRRPRQFVGVTATDYPDLYWQRVFECAANIEGGPVLIVPTSTIGSDLIEWMYAAANDRPKGLIVEHRSGRGNSGGVAYEATVNGIDIYGTNMPEDRSVLFSDRDLECVTHHERQDGRLTTVAFEADDDPHQGRLIVKFDQRITWRPTPVFEFVLGEMAGPDQPGIDDDGDDDR
jgi:hypothetical protein